MAGHTQRIARILPLVTAALFFSGLYAGLIWAPKERMMGDVYRIMFVHVPSAWLTLVAYTTTFAASVAYLWAPSARKDAIAEASAEIGLVFNGILLVTGSIWGRPTWGVWWSWDPRLTTAAILFFAFGGYRALRRLVGDINRRAQSAAVCAIVIFADVPIVWFSVRWWNSLHQLQSSPATVASPMVLALRLNAFAFLALYIVLMRHRVRVGLDAWQHVESGPQMHGDAQARSEAPRKAPRQEDLP